jgi:hypothetical protein
MTRISVSIGVDRWGAAAEAEPDFAALTASLETMPGHES